MEEMEYLEKIIISSEMYRKIERTVIDLYVRNRICSAPINPFEIAEKEGCLVKPISSLGLELKQLLKAKAIDGMSFYNLSCNCYVILYDDTQCIQRQKFTIMHELGHILLEHREESDLAEMCANYFAGYALVPTPLISFYECSSVMDIKQTFDVTEQPAGIRYNAYLNWMCISSCLRKEEEKLLSLFKNNK